MIKPRTTTTRANPTRRIPTGLALAGVGMLVAALGFAGMAPASAAEAKVDLRTVESFSVIAGTTVTNTGPSVIGADLGVSPGSAVTGFPPGTVLGALHVTDAVAGQAQSDLTKAYDDAAGRSSTATIGSDLAGQTLIPGVYTASSSMGLTGALTLDAQGDPNAVFIFQAGTTLITGPNSSVALINGASPCNVYWQVGSSATLDTDTAFVGTVMALTSATLNTGAKVTGRILARNGAVTLDTNVITAPNCAPVVPSPSPTATPTTTPTATPTTAPTTPPVETTGGGAGPVVPEGHPPTGLGGAELQGDNAWTALWTLAGLAAVGAVVVRRRTRLARRG